MMILVAALAAFVMSLLVVTLVERRARAFGLIDVPNTRSSHLQPRPRGGGLGVVLGVFVGLAVMAAAGADLDAGVWAVIIGAAIVAAAGLWDDVATLGPAPKLGAQVLAAGIVMWSAGGFARVPLPPPFDPVLGWIGVPLAIVWIVGVTNFFNFMDGADGLAAGQACITFVAIGWVVWPMPAATVALVAAAATAAFLLRNWAPARVFLGDVGSGWLGFVLAALPFAAPVDRRERLVVLVATSLALFLVDPVLTLARRLVLGRKIGAAHREHAYQQLFDPRGSHGPAVLGLLMAAASITAVAAFAYRQSSIAWWSIGLALVVGVGEWAMAMTMARRHRAP